MDGGNDFFTAVVVTASVFALVYLNDRLCGVANFSSFPSSGLGKINILDLEFRFHDLFRTIKI